MSTQLPHHTQQTILFQHIIVSLVFQLEYPRSSCWGVWPWFLENGDVIKNSQSHLWMNTFKTNHKGGIGHRVGYHLQGLATGRRSHCRSTGFPVSSSRLDMGNRHILRNGPSRLLGGCRPRCRLCVDKQCYWFTDASPILEHGCILPLLTEVRKKNSERLHLCIKCFVPADSSKLLYKEWSI